PSIVTGSVRAGSPVRPTRIVPATAKSIASGTGVALAWRIAWRSDPDPAAWRFVTVKVASRCRLSSASTSQGNDRGAARRRERADLFGIDHRDRIATWTTTM